jgi:hypothetical protein
VTFSTVYRISPEDFAARVEQRSIAARHDTATRAIIQTISFEQDFAVESTHHGSGYPLATPHGS